MAAKVLSLAERMRAAKRKDADEWLEELAGDLSFWKAACETLSDMSFDEDLVENASEITGALEALPGTARFAEPLQELLDGLASLLGEIGGADTFGEFVEAYDAAETALCDYVDLRDAENYAGIADERREAWEEAAAALDLLADQVEQMEDVEDPTLPTSSLADVDVEVIVLDPSKSG